MSSAKPSETAILKLTEAMADRLRLWRTMQKQAHERGDVTVDLHVGELFEPEDAKALDAFEAYLRERSGQVALFN